MIHAASPLAVSELLPHVSPVDRRATKLRHAAALSDDGLACPTEVHGGSRTLPRSPRRERSPCPRRPRVSRETSGRGRDSEGRAFISSTDPHSLPYREAPSWSLRTGPSPGLVLLGPASVGDFPARPVTPPGGRAGLSGYGTQDTPGDNTYSSAHDHDRGGGPGPREQGAGALPPDGPARSARR